ncbi:MAG TPA: protein translocase subunit SecD [Acidimicrobiales bacterium]|nr:protein translocase subunit SecD [Acidimicrobiales bacterium]
MAPENAPSLDEILTPPDADDADRYVLLPSRDRNAVYLLAPAELTGEVVQSATADFPTGQWEVVVQMTSQGADQFDAMAQVYFGRQVAIELDGVVYSAPTINAQEFGGRAIISGSFDEAEAKDLALVLRFGALPVELEPQTVQTVSATLGADALRAGIVSGLIGLTLVAIYMIAYYRLLGMVAMLSLFVSGGLLWFIIAWLGETRGLALSLSGATGIILSIGVAVDSNVVYYERVKEEVKRGRAVRSAAAGSFKDAFSTIVKADTASLIGAFLLYILTIGAVRGFALYLGLATILDMVISYLFMAPMVEILARRFNNRPALLGLLAPEPEEAR